MIKKTIPALWALLLVAFSFSGCVVYWDWFLDPVGAGGTASTGGATGSTGGASACKPGEIAACYDGPEGTEGVGLCKPGSKTCVADGVSFGQCEGAILPVAENCATPVDDDCDGLAPPCKGIPLWSERAGDTADQFGSSVAVDSAGNVLVTGTFYSVVDFAGCSMSRIDNGSPGMFVAKLDPAGKCLWAKDAGDAGSQSPLGIAVDGAGNVLVTGYFFGAMSLDNCSLSNAGGIGLFVAKLDPMGVCQWSEGADKGTGSSVAVDSSGNVFVVGTFDGTMDLAGCSLAENVVSGPGLFVAKLDPMGVCQWSKGASGVDIQDAKSLAVDSSGNILVTGAFSGMMSFAGCSLSTKAPGMFVVKLAPMGECQWGRAAGDAGSQYGRGVAVDNAGNILVTGAFSSVMDLGCKAPLLNAGPLGLFVTKLDPVGGCQWIKGAGGSGSQYGRGVAVDSTGNVLVTGSFSGLLSFGNGAIANAGHEDFFLVKFDAAGGLVWSQWGGGPSDDLGVGVAVDSAGNVLVTGGFNDTADFGTGPLVSAGGSDVFVAKYAP